MTSLMQSWVVVPSKSRQIFSTSDPILTPDLNRSGRKHLGLCVCVCVCVQTHTISTVTSPRMGVKYRMNFREPTTLLHWLWILCCVRLLGYKKSFHTLTVNSIKWHDRQAMWFEGKNPRFKSVWPSKFYSFNSFNSMCVTWCCLYVHSIHSIQCVLPGVVCMFACEVLFVCLLASQANIQTTPGNTN